MKDHDIKNILITMIKNKGLSYLSEEKLVNSYISDMKPIDNFESHCLLDSLAVGSTLIFYRNLNNTNITNDEKYNNTVKEIIDSGISKDSAEITTSILFYAIGNNEYYSKTIDVQYIFKAKIFSEIKFGNYYINNADEKEPLEGIIADEKVEKDSDNETRRLLLSKHAIDVQQYHTKNISTTGKDSSIRHYLNTNLFNECFNKEEKKYIYSSPNTTFDNPEYPKTMFRLTDFAVDLMFLLDFHEIAALINKTSMDNAICSPTKFVLNLQNYYDSPDACAWGLRTNGSNRERALYIHKKGVPMMAGAELMTNYSIRPAIGITNKPTNDNYFSQI